MGIRSLFFTTRNLLELQILLCWPTHVLQSSCKLIVFLETTGYPHRDSIGWNRSLDGLPLRLRKKGLKCVLNLGARSHSYLLEIYDRCRGRTERSQFGGGHVKIFLLLFGLDEGIRRWEYIYPR